MNWDRTLETGIPIIDEQHKEIFRQANLVLNRENENRVPEMIDFLGDYAVKHFGTEELMMKSAKYPASLFEDHQKRHQNFVKAVAILKKEYMEKGHDIFLVIKLQKFILSWLEQHIMGYDKEFALYFKSSGLVR